MSNTINLSALDSAVVSSSSFLIANQDVADLILQTTDYLLGNREEIIQRYGGKTYGILLGQSMGCDVPQFFPIPTDFLSNSSNAVNPGDLQKFEKLLSELDDFFVQGMRHDDIENSIKRITGCSRINLNTEDIELIFEGGSYKRSPRKYLRNLIVKDFLLSNLSVLKHVLNDLDKENIFDKYSFVVDIFVEQFGGYSYDIYDYKGYEGIEKCIRIKSYEGNIIYDIGYDEDFIYGSGIHSYIRSKIIVGLGLVKYKTLNEIDDEVNKAYESLGKYDGGLLRGKIESEADNYNRSQIQKFLGILNENTNFSPEQITYLEKVFSKFRDYPFISVRSSANIEDGGDKNYAGAFYTGFCSTKNFEQFLTEVKNVLASSKNSETKNTKMGITIMVVLGKVNHKKSQDEINLINALYHHSPILRQLYLQDEERYYYPEGGGVMLTDSFSGRVSISSEFGLPVGITAGTGKGFHHDFNSDGTLAQARIQEYNSNRYYRPEYIMGFYSKTQAISEIKNYNLSAYTLKGLDNYNQIYGAFSIEIYKKLVKIGKDLEAKLGYPLDIEFVVHDGKPYIIQLRPYINKYKKPEGFEYPDLEGKEILLDDKSGEAVYCMGYFKEDSLKVVELEPKFTDVGTDTRSPNKRHILYKLLEQEQIGVPYLVYLERNLSVFPEINKSEFPNFKGFVFLGNQTSIASHISMMLRQNEIPTICVDINNVNFSLKNGDNVGIFIDCTKNKSVIYK